MNVLVIGGTRFIGRAIVEELLRRGHTVTVYHRGRHEVEFSRPVAHVHGDRRDSRRFRADLARLLPKAVVDVIPMNADDSQALVEALRGRITRSVHISSGDIYAPGQPIPIPEEAPTGPAEPVELRLDDQTLPYSKVAVEATVRDAQAAGDFPATIMRLQEGCAMPGLERTGLKGTYLCALTENEVERIHDGALQILAQRKSCSVK